MSEEKIESFKITSVSRDDILVHFMDELEPEEQRGKAGKALRKRIEAITDSQMETLARKMADDYIEQLFWTQIGILAEDLVEGKA